MADDGNNTGTGGGGNGGGTMFSQADVNRLLAAERRKTEERFADYDELKKAAEDGRRQADAQKSDIDKLTDSVKALTERASESEAKLARADAVKAHKLPDWVAKKLTSKTADDADREAKEWVENLKATGWKPDGDGGSNTGGGAGAGAGDGDGKGNNTGGGAGGGTGNDGGGNDAGGATGGRAGLAGNGGGRPRENLRSGTAGANNGAGSADDDPKKIADELFSRPF